MKRKGFTLIELLAVIVVLAIIALIATPIVMNTIEKSKKGAAERTADSYVRAVETDIATSYVVDGFYGEVTTTIPVEALNEFIEIKGDKPTSGWLDVEQGVVTDYELEIGDYLVTYDKDKKTSVATKIITYDIELNLTNVISNDSNVNKITNLFPNELMFIAQEGYNLPDNVEVDGATYTWNKLDKKTGILELSEATGNVKITISGIEDLSGKEVYFNVTTGEKCSISDYTETQSNTVVKEGCMKFYIFNYDGGETVNLILDHNTTAGVTWNNTDKFSGGRSNNSKGPKEVLEQLKTDTESWQGTMIPANYTMYRGKTSNSSYTIDYSSYKARLITAQEVAQITENTFFDEKTSSSNFYFDTKTTSESTTCKSGDTTGCKYGWLYDRTNTNCTRYGCLNNADTSTPSDMQGYWTASSRNDFYNRACGVWMAACLSAPYIDGTNNRYGVRQVIEVLRSKIL